MTLLTGSRTPPLISGGRFIGNLGEFMRDPVALMRRGQREQGPVFTVRMGPRRAAVVVGPAESKAAIAQPETVLAVAPVYQWLRPMFGAVMQAADHEVYLRQRDALMPAFRSHHHDAYLTAMAAEVRAWLGRLGTEGTFDIGTELDDVSMRIAMRIFLGPEFEPYRPRFRRLFTDIAAGMEFFLPANAPLPRLIRRNRARREAFELMRPYLERVRQDPDPERYGFLGHLVRSTASEPMDDETLGGLIMILVYAAYETTSAQTGWALVLLLQHPAIARRVRDEVCDLLPGPVDVVEDDDLAPLRRAGELSRCLLEAQRLRPVTTMLTRQTATAYRVGDFTVPAGWQTLFCPPVTHRDEDLYPDPDRFDPGRFAPDRDAGGVARSGLLNQGGGLHACLGTRFAELEMGTILGLLTRCHDLELMTPEPAAAPGLGIMRLAPTTVGYHQRF
ncbi:cytochrome P450 [Kineosporia sp. NBRC 101731]|uniref:cytochrome P450 n=1 Tax=Kineosporia sp. NBRC 101731 TaxID=3032199 RepID=UPI0024A00E20|nr:cytochrome P450 [Kineosporia sp. NBRC 101731]GLY30388.1 cytochrome P450 [Kineosporia sp. NBRC 101731]